MILRTALASLAVAGSLAGAAQATVTSATQALPAAHERAADRLGRPVSFTGFDCPGCVDVKFAPAPVRYHRARYGRARHGRVLRVRG